MIALLIATRGLPVTQFNGWVAHMGIWDITLFIAVYILALITEAILACFEAL